MTDELNVLAGAYALDALDPDERAVFEEHLKGCAECSDEVLGMRLTAAELSRLDEIAPPPQLRVDILSAISSVRPMAPIVADNVIPFRSRISRSVWQMTAAACALIAILASGWGYSQHRDSHGSPSAAASVVTSVLDAPDVTARTTTFAQGQGTVVYSRSLQKLVVVTHNMPALAADKTYQLWKLPSSGKPISAGVFSTDHSGTVELPVAGNLNGIDQLGISVEPSGGSAQPTAGTVRTLDL